MEAITLSAKNAAIIVRNQKALAAYKLTKVMKNKKERFKVVLDNGTIYCPENEERLAALKTKFMGKIKTIVTC